MSAIRKAVAVMAGLLVGAICCAYGAIYSFTDNGGGSYSAGWNGSVNVPDYDASGVAFGLDFGPAGSAISSVDVTVKISGGWNGDLYAYLSHGSDYSVLLNRVGAGAGSSDGYATKGFDVRLVSSGSDVHWYGANGGAVNGSGQLTGDWAADGRVSYLDTDRSRTLGVFNGKEASGGWTLFFADMASGGGVSKLEGWSVNVDVTPVPEPWVWGAGSGVALAGICLARELRRWRQGRGG